MYRSVEPYYEASGPFNRMFNQHFGGGLFDHELPLCPVLPSQWGLGASLRPRRIHSGQESGVSEIECTKEKFAVKLDVHQFLPNEITVKLDEAKKDILIEGHHEEKEDVHGYISRTFRRRYHLPENCADKMDKVAVHLSSDGVLEISVPRCDAIKDKDCKAKVLPITQTGKPAIAHSHGPACDKICPNKQQQNGAASEAKNTKA